MKSATRLMAALLLLAAGCSEDGNVPGPLQLIDGGVGSGELGPSLPPTELGTVVGPSLDWAQRYGGPAADLPWNAASDRNGNVYLVGRFDSPSLSLGGSPLVGGGGGDIFLASFSASGQPRWSIPFGGSSEDTGRAIGTHEAGVFIAGDVCSSSVNFGGGSLPGPTKNDIFLAGFTEAGNYRWAKRLTGDYHDYAYGLAFDGGGNLYLTGCFASLQIDFGGGPVSASDGEIDVFVASYSSNGAHRWSQRFASATPSCAQAVVTDGGGNLYVAGYFSGWIRFGDTTLQSSGESDGFVASFTSTGALRWVRRFGSVGPDRIRRMVVSGESLFLVGTFSGTASFGSTKLVSAGGTDIVLARVTTGGEALWAKRLGGPGDDYPGGFLADSRGNLALTGLFHQTIEIDGTSLASKGGSDALLASFSPDGSRRWAIGLGGSENDQGSGLAAGADGVLYLAGIFRGAVDFGRGTLTSAGEDDIFLLRITAP